MHVPSVVLTLAVIPLIVAGDPGQRGVHVEERPDGGAEVVQGPGDDHVVVEADADGDEKHCEADP